MSEVGQISVNKMNRKDPVVRKRKQLQKEKKLVIAQKLQLQEMLAADTKPDERESELHQLVFGGNLDEELLSDGEEGISPKKKKEVMEPEKEKAPAWIDEDDENILVSDKAGAYRNCHRSISLRGEEKYSTFVQEKFAKLVGTPSWAELNKEDAEDSESESDEFLMKTGNFVQNSLQLPKGQIHILRCPSLLETNLKGSIVKCVEFNPVSNVALVASTNETVNLFQIDAKVNAKIQSVHFEKFPVHTAHFTTNGTEIIAGSNMFGHFFSYDMLAGKIVRIPRQKGMEQQNIRKFQVSPDGKYIVIHGRYGHIHLMTTKSKEWIGSMKMNGEVIATTFNKDGSKLYSHGVTGEVYIWDISSRKCIHKFVDEGCISGTSLALSPNNQFLAAGSDSGIVNIYDNQTIYSSASPQPLKVLKNLTTEITHMKFNHTSELLAMLSSHKPHAMKLVHFPSMSVFSNFPNEEHCRNIRTVNSIDISLNSGYMCTGTNSGRASVFRLKHFKNY